MARKKTEAPKVEAVATPVEEATAHSEVKRKPIRLDVLPSDYERISDCAGARGLTMSSYARMALLDYLKRDEKGHADTP